MVRTSRELRPANVAGRQGEVPIGGIISWYKALIGVGSQLPDGYVECNGQVLSDPESPLTGQTIPDINGSISAQQNFIRHGTAASASAAGNADAVTSVPAVSLSNSSTSFTSPGGSGLSVITAVNMTVNGAACQSQILPKYFLVVAVMRVR